MKRYPHQAIMRLACLFAIGMGLSHCASTQESQQETALPASAYLQQATTATTGSQQNYYRLKASSAFLAQNNAIQAASHTLQQLTPDAPQQFPALYQLVQAQLQWHRHRPDHTLNDLNGLQLTHLTSHEQRLALQTQSLAAWQLGRYALSLEASSQWLQRTASAKAQQAWLTHTWKQLQNLNPNQLQSLANNTDTTVQAWGQLGLIAKQPLPYKQLQSRLHQWQKAYSHTVAAALVQVKQSKYRYTKPSNIALFLPLSGTYAQSGNAIKNGFFSAYYQHKGLGYAPNIRVYDTTTQPIKTLYKLATQAGAQCIVGPLLKQNVAKLSHLSLRIPTITLNQTTAAYHQPNLVQYALSPTDEASQAAGQAWHAGLRRALVFAPQTTWGKQVASHFVQRWEGLGGRIVNATYYSSQPQALHRAVEQSLLVDHSYARMRRLRAALGKKVRFIPRQRQDADMIFLVGDSQAASQIRPFLRYYFSGRLPVYAISNVNNHAASHQRDLTGVHFPDVPWLVKPTQMNASLQRIQTDSQFLWQHDNVQQKRLYAMGVDAYQIMLHWTRLHAMPQFGLAGATGTLYLSPQGQIQRQLPWTRIQHGKMVSRH